MIMHILFELYVYSFSIQFTPQTVLYTFYIDIILIPKKEVCVYCRMIFAVSKVLDRYWILLSLIFNRKSFKEVNLSQKFSNVHENWNGPKF